MLLHSATQIGAWSGVSCHSRIYICIPLPQTSTGRAAPGGGPRGPVVRSPRRPADGGGFQGDALDAEERTGVYRPTGSGACAGWSAELDAWARSWRAGRYAVEVRVRHSDGVRSTLDGGLAVTPRGGVRWMESLPDSWGMYDRAFTPVHGRGFCTLLIIEAL